MSSSVSPPSSRSRNSSVRARSCVVGQVLDAVLLRVDLRDDLLELLDPAPFTGAQDLLKYHD
jgi:hypothetical protein